MTRPRLARVSRAAVALLLLPLASLAVGQEAAKPSVADELLRLVPGEAGAVLVLDDLRGHSREIAASGLIDRLRQTPAFRRWREAGGIRVLERSIADLESLLGTNWRAVRDELLGDALVLSVHVRPGEPADRARGLLIARPRDRKLLDRLIASLNGLERASGALSSLDERRRGEVAYTARLFADAARAPDYYAILPDGSFLWTSDEALLHTSLDRLAGKAAPGLVDHEGYRQVGPALPDLSLLRIFVEPTFVRAMAAADPSAPKLEDFPGPVRAAIERIRYVGLALEWRGDLVLHEVDWSGPLEGSPEAKPAAADWLARALARVPSRPLALASATPDFGRLYDVALDLLSEQSPPQRERLETLLRGVLLDQDPRLEVFSRIGPRVLAYAMPPVPGASRPIPPTVLVIGLNGDEGLGRSLSNALRTTLALTAIDAVKRKQDWRIRADGALTLFDRSDREGSPMIAFGSTADWFVLGTSPELVSSFLSASPGPSAPGPLFAEVRAKYLESAPAFAFVDLMGLARSLREHEEALALSLSRRRGGDVDEAQARSDLAQLISLLDLAHAAFYADRPLPGRLHHRSLGLVFSSAPVETP